MHPSTSTTTTPGNIQTFHINNNTSTTVSSYTNCFTFENGFLLLLSFIFIVVLESFHSQPTNRPSNTNDHIITDCKQRKSTISGRQHHLLHQPKIQLIIIIELQILVKKTQMVQKQYIPMY